MFEKVLVAVDGSEHSKHAVDTAANLANCYQSSILLLHVIRSLDLPKELMKMISEGEITASPVQILQDSADIILDNAEEKFKAAGVSIASRTYLVGDPAVTIADYAEKQGVDLILIGYRGLGTHSNILGSVARKLLNISKISCLIVK